MWHRLEVQTAQVQNQADLVGSTTMLCSFFFSPAWVTDLSDLLGKLKRKIEEERRGGGNMKWRENSRSIGEDEKKKERHHLVKVTGYSRECNNSWQNSFHHKTCLMRAYVGFLLDCCTNLPPTEAACALCQLHAHFVNHNNEILSTS